jgi:hypothetical protein
VHDNRSDLAIIARFCGLGVFALGLLWHTDVPAQRAAMTAATIRTLVKEAQSAARGDNDEFVLGLDARVRARWGDFESFPISIVRRDDLRVMLSAPYMTYRRTLAEYLLIDRPVADVPWIDAAVVAVEPLQIGAPDVLRITVERGDRDVRALDSQLRPMTFANGSGGAAVLHAGDVRFPMTAFAPGATVTIAAIPAEGASFVATLNDSQLSTLK